MIVYNVTITLDESIEKEWLDWLQNEHIHEVLETGKFKNARLTKIISHQEKNQVSYSVQYFCESREMLDAYYKEDSERLRKDGVSKFSDKMLAFRTELELIGDFYAAVKN